MRPPIATYRIQFHPGFDFRAARSIVDYLADLGITDLYASPVFEARTGSPHGYDVTDPNRLNPELGGEAEFESLFFDLQNKGMGWLQDIVPNHMAFSPANRMLMDVFESGPDSAYYHFFDIDWDHYYPGLKGRVMTPFLGGPYGEALSDGLIRLVYNENGFCITYYDRAFPLSLDSYSNLLEPAAEGSPILQILEALQSARKSADRARAIFQVKQDLWKRYQEDTRVRDAVDAAVQSHTLEPGEPENLRRLDRLISRQFFRLAFWKRAGQEINYRRFFQINDLICLRAEDEAVFAHTHTLLLNLVREGKITGLRVDHVDGLADPAGYLRRLRSEAEDAFVVVEKILESDEEIPESWPIQGTTGYEFLNRVNGVLCRRENGERFERIYHEFTGMGEPLDHLTLRHRIDVLEDYLAGEMDNLTFRFKGVTARNRFGSDFSYRLLRDALSTIIARFPVYRSYLNPGPIRETDRRRIDSTMEKAKTDAPGLAPEIDFIHRVLLREFDDPALSAPDPEWQTLVARFQQLTAPLAAKGFEDTTLYVYNRLLSLNDVGGDPGEFGCSPAEFDEFNRRKIEGWPHGMNATATHDTKRGEDVRARITVLSEIPGQWEERLHRWREINRPLKTEVDGREIPDANESYLLYQTLLGSYPFDDHEVDQYVARIQDYFIKALREGERHSSWIDSDENYEQACTGFVERLLDRSEDNPFLKDFLPFQNKIAFYGMINSLSQTLIKISAPGIPDFYQGTELWDLSLVDPDNRRPVDFAKRRIYLEEIQNGGDGDRLGLIRLLLSSPRDGRIKLFLIHQALKTRNAHSDLFATGGYLPLEVRGDLKSHLIAFARTSEDRWAMTVAPRFVTDLTAEGEFPLGPEVWQDTEIILPIDSPLRWRNVLTDEHLEDGAPIPAGVLLKHFPAAFCISEDNL